MNKGFTLIEMMVVVAIIGILAAVALPSYQESVRKSRRSDAVVMIAKIQQAEEKWRANNASYTKVLGPEGLNISTSAETVVSGSGYYNVTVSAPGSSGYIITAEAIAEKSQSKDTQCLKLVMTVSNGNTTAIPDNCWSK
jgi:type IV pilus assembly protein PilE